MMLKSEVEAFLDGYKPAILIGENSNHLLKLDAYPSLLIDRERDYMSHLFFQTEEAKNQYLQKILNIEQDSYEDHYLLGITLGLPEKSVDFFAKTRVHKNKTGQTSKESEIYGVGVIWAGFSFAGHLEYLQEEISWLWETYRHPRTEGLPLYLCPEGNEMIPIPHQDQAKLVEGEQQIRQLRGLL